MGVDLFGKQVQDTYDAIIKVGDNNTLTSTAKRLSDGRGTDAPIWLSTTKMGIGVTPDLNYTVTINGSLKATDIDTTTLQFLGGTGTQGTLSWNTDEETVDIIQNGATLQVGQEIHVHVKNQTGVGIPDGTPVYVTGTLGSSGRLTVAPMIADGTIEAKYFLGITTEDIPNGEDGKVTTFGKIRGLDTSAYTEGQTLYVSSTTAGAFQTTAPISPNLDLEVAIVINVSATVGTIFVRANNGLYLPMLHDVYIDTPTDGQALVYNATEERWENADAGGTTSENLIIENNSPSISLIDTSPSPDGGRVDLKNVNTDFLIQVDPDNVADSSTIQFELDGVERMRLNATGFGIGTVSPQETFHINSGVDNNVALFESTDSTASIYLKDSTGETRFRQSAEAFIIENDVANTLANSYISFRIDDTERLRIDTDGNLLLQTAEKHIRLESSGTPNGYIRMGDIYTTNGLELFGDNAVTIASDLYGITVSDINNAITFNANGVEVARFDSSGRLGLGTTSPDTNTNIHLLNSGNIAFRLESSTADAITLQFGSTTETAYGRLRYDSSSHDMRFYTNNTEQMRIDQDGNLGIGTTPNASSKLHVKDDDGAEIRLEDNTSTTFSVLRFVGDASTYEKGLIAYNSANAFDANALHLFNSAGDIVFRTDDSGGTGEDRIRIDGSDGSVTINQTLYLEANDSLAFEGGSHWITYNDGGGNFNIRVGHKDNSSGTEETTEAGYVLHDEWSQSGGWRQFLVSDVSTAVGDLQGTDWNWNLQLQYDYQTVILYWEGDARLATTSTGVEVFGNLNFSGNLSLDDGASITSDSGAQLITTNSGETWTVRNGGGSDPILTLQDSLTNVLTTFDVNGYLGIGAVPLRPLDVIGSVGSAVATFATEISGGTNRGIRIVPETFGATISAVGLSTELAFGTSDAVSTAERMRIDSNGNVGIGTSSPSAKLEIDGTGTLFKVSGAASREFFIDTTNPDHLKKNQNLVLHADPSNSHADTKMTFDIDGDTKMMIDSDGRVGIGTESFSSNLHIEGAGNTVVRIISSTDEFSQVQFGDSADVNVGRITYDHSVNDMYFYVADSEVLRIDSDGNVGIGTSSPYTALDVSGGTINQVAIFRSSDTTATIGFADNTTPLTANLSYVTVGAVGNNMVFNTNLSERMRIDSSGNVGIGVSPDSDAELHIYRNGSAARIRVEREFNPQLDLESLNGYAQIGTLNNFPLAFQTNGSERLRITSSGDVGIGTTSPDAGGTVTLVDRVLRSKNVDGDSGFDFYESGTGGLIRQRNNRPIYLYTNNAIRTTIDEDGRMGINETSPSAYLHITSSDTSDLTHFLLENNNSGAASGPNLALYRNSASPANNDALGNILFYGKDSAGTQIPYAEIFSEIADTTAGAHDGRLVFYNYIDGVGDYSMVLEGRKLGIGETNPDANIHIKNTGLTSQKFENFGTAYWNLGIPSGETYFAFDNINDNLSAPKMTISSAGDLTVAGNLNASGKLQLGSTANSAYLTGDAKISADGYAMANALLNVRTTGTTATGMVFGIGATYQDDYIQLVTDGVAAVQISPTQVVEINGRLNANSTVFFYDAVTFNTDITFDVSSYEFILNRGASTAVGLEWQASGAVQWQQYHYANGDLSFYNVNGNDFLLENTNVGIGKSPSYTLDVNGTIQAYDTVRIDSSSVGSPYLAFYQAGAQSAYLQYADIGDELKLQSNGLFTLITNGTNSTITVDASNNVGINNTSPSQELDVTGDGRFTGDLFLGQFLYHNGDTNTYMRFDADRIRLFAGGVEMLDLVEGGTDYVDIADTVRVDKTNNYLECTGDIIGYTSTTISDANKKENVKTIDSPIDKIKQINGYTFDWKHNGKASAGVIAQEVEKILPEAVQKREVSITSEEPYLTVEYNGIIALLIETVKEQQEMIEDLKAEINNLKGLF